VPDDPDRKNRRWLVDFDKMIRYTTDREGGVYIVCVENRNILGPSARLMPKPKLGTVTFDVAEGGLKKQKVGKVSSIVNWRKTGLLPRCAIGKQVGVVRAKMRENFMQRIAQVIYRA
jgi:ribosomal protein L1